MLNEPLFDLVPTEEFMEPVKPSTDLRLVIILTIPAVPSPSYLADGEVITSTLLI